MTRFVLSFVALALFAGCSDATSVIPTEFQVIEQRECPLGGVCAYVRDTRHDICFLVLGIGNTSRIASVPCDKVVSPVQTGEPR